MKRAKPKPVLVWVDESGAALAKDDYVKGQRRVTYVPRDSSAEGRAARYERVLRKIAKIKHANNCDGTQRDACPGFLAEEVLREVRELAREGRRA